MYYDLSAGYLFAVPSRLHPPLLIGRPMENKAANGRDQL